MLIIDILRHETVFPPLSSISHNIYFHFVKRESRDHLIQLLPWCVAGTTWMNWCLFGVICASIPLLILMKQTFSRADLDEQEIVVPDPNPSTQTEYGLQKERLTYDSPISV